MKNLALFFIILGTSILQSQTNEDLSSEIDVLNNELGKINSKIEVLKNDIAEVKSDNLYLKKVLDINKPILEVEKDGVKYTVTKVTGNKQEKNIQFEMLFEAVKENTKSEIAMGIKIIDIEGNEYKLDFGKSTSLHRDLFKDVPLKAVFTFKAIENEPKIIKMLSFSTSNKYESSKSLFDRTKSNLEFRDLNVTWN